MKGVVEKYLHLYLTADLFKNIEVTSQYRAILEAGLNKYKTLECNVCLSSVTYNATIISYWKFHKDPLILQNFIDQIDFWKIGVQLLDKSSLH